MDKIYLFEFNGKKYYFDYLMLLGIGEKTPVFVKALHKQQETYHPARTTVTAFRIGAFYTASINTREEHFTTVNVKTSKGKISIDGVENINELYLSDQLVEEAKKAKIFGSNLLEGGKLKLREPAERLREDEILKMQKDVMSGKGSSDAVYYLNGEVDKHYYLDYYIRVCDFISKALDGGFLTNDQIKQLEEAAIEHLSASNKAEDWYVLKTYLSQYTDENTKDIINKLDAKLSTAKKYVEDGIVFYDVEKYLEYTKNKSEEKRKKDETKGLLIIGPILIGLLALLLSLIGIL